MTGISSESRVRQGVAASIRGRRRRRRESPKLPRASGTVAWHTGGLLIFLAALGLIAYETGVEASGGHQPARTFWQSLTTTISKPAVAIPLASLLVLGIANVLRRLWSEWLAIKPGPIFVHELSVSPGLSDVDVAQLTTAFRRRLMQMRLRAPTPVPGTTPAQDFLSVLDGDHLDTKNVLGSAVSILRAAIPTHAYEVSVTLAKEAAEPPAKSRCGVTAQVSRVPNEGIPVETAWAYSWDDAITQAADMVTAAVLPRTVLSNRQPWSGWRRYPMPGMLVHHYERAQELTTRRRYDEALDHYFQALALDPKNVDLRLHKGFVEEKLGLYLDAVATYAAARRIADETSTRLYHRRARRNRAAAGSIARYRLAVLLGGLKFAHQWRKRDEHTLRDAQRLLLRRRLNPELQQLLEQHGLMPSTKQAAKDPDSQLEREDLLALLEECRGGLDDDADPRYYELRQKFGELARKELLDVRRKLIHRSVRPESLTPLSVDLTVRWLDLRLEYVERRLDELAATPLTPSTAWDLRPESVLPLSRRPFQTWTDEYNAACLFALPLLLDAYQRDADLKARSEELANRAVEHLKRAMSSTVSWYAAQRRDWVLSEDPDLDGLRRSPEFKHFEAIYFPSPSRTPPRPRGIHRWEQSRYTHLLLAQTAHRWETVWHQRRDSLLAGNDPHVSIEWCVDEAEAWRLVECMARDYRHWRVRLDLIEQMLEWSAKYGFEPLGVEVPRFVPENGMSHDDIAKAVGRELANNGERLNEIVRKLEAMTRPKQPEQSDNHALTHGRGELAKLPSQLRYRAFATKLAAVRAEQLEQDQLNRLQIELRNRDFWHRAPPRLYLPSVCDAHAAMWQRLHEWLDEKPNDHRTARSEFAFAVSQAARLSGTAHGLWRVAVVDRRIRGLASGSRPDPATAANGTLSR
jgi:tetratricopeptide (TPR) repeat protein